MKRVYAAALLPALLACGCASMNNTEKGAAAGGVIGAGTGALVGSAVHRPGIGALAGAGIGAVSGALVGNAIDENDRKNQARVAAATAPPPLGLTDIVAMAQQHISDTVIISQIRTTGSVYRLSPSDIEWLKANGVSDAVVIEMQATASRYPRRVYSATPVYGPAPVYVVEPAPPPPVAVGVGVGFSSGGGRWCH